MSLAERVCHELGEMSGPGCAESLCGYQVRFDSRQSATTRLTYLTTGVLLRRLHSDAELNDISCVIVDEVSGVVVVVVVVVVVAAAAAAAAAAAVVIEFCSSSSSSSSSGHGYG